jgi:hypothetical protein
MAHSKSDKHFLDRRSFLATFALGATAAPMLSLGRSVFAGEEEAAQNSLCYSNKRVLRDSDLTYLGAMRVPNSGNVRMDFSYGQMTGRRVNGQVRLLMAGNVTMGDQVYEFADTGSYHPTPAQAPRMSLVRAWGDIYGNARKTWNGGGVEQTIYARYPGNLFWSEQRQLLYWTYYGTYNVTLIEDWCLGATRLDPAGPVAFGPWRPAGGGKKGPWRCTRLAEHPSGEMLCGASLASGAANSPWGPDLWYGGWPTASTPAGFGAPDLPIGKYLTYYPFFGAINNDGSFNGPIRSCRRPGDYFFEPFPTGIKTQIDPHRNGGVGSWTDIDYVNGMSWIDLPDVHGVLFTGKLGAAHIWYSSALNNHQCTHGVGSPVQVTGPVSTDAYPVMIFYDPVDLNAVRAGQKTDYTVDPIQLTNAQSRFGIQTARLTAPGSARSIAGVYFDAPSRKLYIAAPEADETTPGIANPLVHVFSIA